MSVSSEVTASFNALLAARGLTVPDRRALYAYRFTKEEYERGALLLRRHGRRALLERHGCALILVHVAEWFRREREGGHWDWIRPLRSIGLDYGQGLAVQYVDVEAMVRTGLAVWRRPMVEGGERLLAVVRESGFPVAAVRDDPRISAWLRHAVLCAERGFQVDQAVASEAWRVSDRLAQALFEPAIDLCAAIVNLRASISAETRDLDPVPHLDAQQPGWRKALPFDVEQEDLRTLIERMVRLRETGGAALVVERDLVVRAEGGWIPRASLTLDGALDPKRLPSGVAAALVSNRRLRIFSRPPFSHELVAVAAIETLGDDEERRHELRPFVMCFEANLALEDEVRLLAQSGHANVGEFVPPGGQALTEPIVALDVAEVDDSGQPRRLRVIGSSSCQSSKQTLALAAAPELVSSIRFSDGYREIGVCNRSGRRLILFSGVASLDRDGARWRWRTSAERNLGSRPILIGDLVPNVRETIFLGMPKLWVEREGQMIAARADTLFWRPRGRGSWRKMEGSTALGAIDMAVIVEGEFRHSISADVVPANMRFTFDRGRRELRLSGLGAVSVAAVGAQPLRIRAQDGDRVVELGPPSGTPIVTVRIRWETEIALTIADPSYELRLIDENDQLMDSRASFALDRLDGPRILATREVALYLELRAPDAPRLAISRSVTGDVPLSALRDTIRQLLGSSSGLDAKVVVSGLGATEHLAEVRWYGEDVNPFAAPVRGGPFSTLLALHDLDLRAVSLVAPAAGSYHVTAPASEAAMRAELSPSLPYGPWLLFGRRKSGEIVRPRVIAASRPPVAPTPLVKAVTTAWPTARARAFDAVYADPSAMEREDLRRLVDMIVLARRYRLPAASIDALRALERVPAAAVQVLSICDTLEERAALLDLQRDLPFLWCATLISSWVKAFLQRFEGIQKELNEVGVDIDVARVGMSTLREIVDLRPELIAHARAAALSIMAVAASNGAAIDGSMGSFLRVGRSTTARQEIDRMITRHGDDNRPPSSLLSEATLAAQKDRWERYDPAYAHVIAAPFAVAEHATGGKQLTTSELLRCRDAALYEPEYFEVIVPMRINETLHTVSSAAEAAA